MSVTLTRYLGKFSSLTDLNKIYAASKQANDFARVNITSWYHCQMVEGNVLGWVDCTQDIQAQIDAGFDYYSKAISTDKINYLGAYADLSAVWAAFPEGGHAGDYVYDNDDLIVRIWNRYRNNWTEDNATHTPAIQGHTVDGDLQVTGDLDVTGNVYATLYEKSDERAKDFGERIPSDVEALSALRKSYFKYKECDGKNEIGVSAQEIERIYPEIVSRGARGILYVNYAKLSVVALAYCDVLLQRIKDLENAIKRDDI